MHEAYLAGVRSAGAALLEVVAAMEQIARRLDPAAIPRLRELMEPRARALEVALDELQALDAPAEGAGLGEQLLHAGSFGVQAATLFANPGGEQEALPRVLAAMHAHCRAQEMLYPLRRILRPVGRYFAEPALHDRLDELDPDPPEGVDVGIFGPAQEEDGPGRGDLWLYVPERYDGSSDWPLVVALHGGSGRGRDFLWSWVREARSRQVLLAAPTSLGPTWSIQGKDVDAPLLNGLVDKIAERWRVDRSRVLLTGLSDGATYSLLCGLQEGSPYTALAPLSGVLHPALLVGSGLAAAQGRRIYLVHGSHDWMFPIAIAHLAREALEKAGADLCFRELADLSHTYAREENAKILEWLDPTLALD